MDSDDQVVQLAVTRERLRHADEKNSQQEESLKQAYVTIGQLEAKLQRATEDSHDMRVKLEVTKQELTHTKQTLNQSSQQTTGKDRQAKWRAFLASILFLMTSVLAGVGASMLASTPPNLFGWTLIALGTVVYIVATVLTTLLT